MSAFYVNPLLGFGIVVGGIALGALTADARLALVALVAQYAGAAAVMAAGSASAIAWLHLAVGGLAAAILYLGIRARSADRLDRAATAGLPFRAVALLMALAAGGVLAVRWPLPHAGGLTSLACFALAAGFVAQVGVFQQPARIGMATLTLLTAASMYTHAAGGSLLLVALVLCGHLFTALAASRFQATPSAGQEEPR